MQALDVCSPLVEIVAALAARASEAPGLRAATQVPASIPTLSMVAKLIDGIPRWTRARA